VSDCPTCSEELCKFGKCHQCDSCDNHAEAAYERWLESYYGGDGPQTDRERQEAAYKEFKR
jgi:hypothetical protein